MDIFNVEFTDVLKNTVSQTLEKQVYEIILLKLQYSRKGHRQNKAKTKNAAENSNQFNANRIQVPNNSHKSNKTI